MPKSIVQKLLLLLVTCGTAEAGVPWNLPERLYHLKDLPAQLLQCKLQGGFSQNDLCYLGLSKELETLSKCEMQPDYNMFHPLLVKLNKRLSLSRYAPSSITVAGCAWERGTQASTYWPARLLAPRLLLTCAGSCGLN